MRPAWPHQHARVFCVQVYTRNAHPHTSQASGSTCTLQSLGGHAQMRGSLLGGLSARVAAGTLLSVAVRYYFSRCV